MPDLHAGERTPAGVIPPARRGTERQAVFALAGTIWRLPAGPTARRVENDGGPLIVFMGDHHAPGVTGLNELYSLGCTDVTNAAHEADGRTSAGPSLRFESRMPTWQRSARTAISTHEPPVSLLCDDLNHADSSATSVALLGVLMTISTLVLVGAGIRLS